MTSGGGHVIRISSGIHNSVDVCITAPALMTGGPVAGAALVSGSGCVSSGVPGCVLV
jgi:hypothetical protein